MSNNGTSPPGAMFWGVSGIALVWNLIGLIAYWGTVTLTRNDLLQMSEVERALYTDLPVWVTSAFAIAVVTGLLGSLGLLLRKRWAMPLFVVSLAATAIQRIHMVFMTDFVKVVDAASMVLPVLVIIVAVFLVFFARYAAQRDWLI